MMRLSIDANRITNLDVEIHVRNGGDDGDGLVLKKYFVYDSTENVTILMGRVIDRCPCFDDEYVGVMVLGVFDGDVRTSDPESLSKNANLFAKFEN